MVKLRIITALFFVLIQAGLLPAAPEESRALEFRMVFVARYFVPGAGVLFIFKCMAPVKQPAPRKSTPPGGGINGEQGNA